MTIPVTQTRLIESLQRQEERYTDAAAIIERLGAASSLSDPSRQKDLINLQNVLSAIRSAGKTVDDARIAYEADTHPKSPDLASALKQQETKLTTLLNRINDLVDTFSGSKDQIQSQLDSRAVRRSMHQAYQQSMKTG